jgi:hypothetical protein
MYIYHNELMCFTDAIKLYLDQESRPGLASDVRKACRRWEKSYRLRQGYGCECYALWCTVLGGTGLSLAIPSVWSYENRLLMLDAEGRERANKLTLALSHALDALSCETDLETNQNRLVEFILALARLCEVET